jgi:hypothetical protein
MRLPFAFGRFFSYLLISLGLFTLAACDDPTSVGRGLIEQTGEQIAVVEIDPESTSRIDSLSLLTGSSNTGSNNRDRLRRVLTGRVVAPKFGEASATGYVDFAVAGASVPDTVEVLGISLQLPLAYRYGDTTRALPLQLRNMPDDWDAQDATADTTLEAGALVDEYEIDPAGSSISVPLPDDWVSDRIDALRDTTFGNAFNGFQIAPQLSSNTVIGFRSAVGPGVTSSRLRVATSTDTMTYPLAKTLTTLARSSDPASPANRLVIQNGVGPQVGLDFDFEEGRQTNAVVEDTSDVLQLTGHVPNRAELVLHADTSLAKPSPGFVRPELDALALYATLGDGSEAVLVSNAARDDDSGRYVLSTGSLRSSLKRVLQEEATITGFRVSPGFTGRFGGNPVKPVSVTPLALYGPAASCPDGSDACTPVMRLTLTLVK